MTHSIAKKPSSEVPANLPGNTRWESIPKEKQTELKKLQSACKDFESIFVLQMLKEMKKTVHKSGLINGGFAEEVFSDMLDQERSKEMTIGIGNVLFLQLSRAIIPSHRKR